MHLYWSEPDQAWIVAIPDLPGAMADGETPEAAVAMAQEVIALWIETARERGQPIPEPQAEPVVQQRYGLAGGRFYLAPGRRVTAMTATFTAVFEQDGDWWVGYVEELPGANTQGATLEEARENLKEAVALIIEANRELAQPDVDIP